MIQFSFLHLEVKNQDILKYAVTIINKSFIYKIIIVMMMMMPDADVISSTFR